MPLKFLQSELNDFDLIDVEPLRPVDPVVVDDEVGNLFSVTWEDSFIMISFQCVWKKKKIQVHVLYYLGKKVFG